MTKEPISKDESKPPSEAGTDRAPAALSPEMIGKIETIRNRIQSGVGQVAMAMAVLPRYRNLPFSDLMPLVLDPLMRDRIAIASTTPPDGKSLQAPVGIAIWASVSAEVDARIREQISAGVFPIRLRSEDWASGEINWLLDVIAPTEKLAGSVIANFKQVIKQGELRIHPMIRRLVDADQLRSMGAVALGHSDTKAGTERPAPDEPATAEPAERGITTLQ